MGCFCSMNIMDRGSGWIIIIKQSYYYVKTYYMKLSKSENLLSFRMDFVRYDMRL